MSMIKITVLLLIASFTTAFTSVSAHESKIRVYGFFDLEAEVSNKDAAGRIWTFDQHHLNIIAIYQIDQRMRVFSEVEYEHGISHKLDNMTGQIYVAKSFFEYKFSDALLVRAGKFMTPFGIYNERHDATPTFIFTVLPQSFYGEHTMSTGAKSRIFAKSATGLQFRGVWNSANWETGYQFYVTNGRGENPDERDDNPNKGVGARLTVAQSNQGVLLGASFYSDRNGLDGNARQTSYALDAQFDHSALHVESELILSRLEGSDSSGAPNETFRNHLGTYVQAWYSIKEVFSPFARYEITDHDRSISNTFTVLGLNYSISPVAVLKAEVHFNRFKNSGEQNHELFVTSVAVAF